MTYHEFQDLPGEVFEELEELFQVDTTNWPEPDDEDWDNVSVHEVDFTTG